MKKWIFTALALSALVLPAAAFAGKDHPFLTFGPGKVSVNEKTKQASITNAPGQWGGALRHQGGTVIEAEEARVHLQVGR